MLSSLYVAEQIETIDWRYTSGVIVGVILDIIFFNRRSSVIILLAPLKFYF